MIRTQVTKLDELTGATIEGARWCDTLDVISAVLLLLSADRYIIISGSHGNYPGDDPRPCFDEYDLSSLFQHELIDLGLVNEAGLEKVKHQAENKKAYWEKRRRDDDLATLKRLKEEYE